MDDYDVIYNGPSMATILLAITLILLLVGLLAAWLNQQPKPAPAPPPPPPAPAPPSPKAPAPPAGCAKDVEQWLATMKSQIKAVAFNPYHTPPSAFDTLFDPTAEHVLNIVRNYEARVQSYSETCKRMIEK